MQAEAELRQFVALETRYCGCTFRSRLEARWAAFFDQWGWAWDYEPLDLKGWVPDFIIVGNNCEVLVEVKPYYGFNEEVAVKMERAACIEFDLYSFWSRRQLLLLGASPFAVRDPAWMGGTEFGWLFDGCEWQPAHLGRWKDGAGQVGFCHETQSFRDRITHGYDGGCFGELGLETDEIKEAWNKAGSAVQWKPSHERA